MIKTRRHSYPAIVVCLRLSPVFESLYSIEQSGATVPVKMSIVAFELVFDLFRPLVEANK